MVLTVRRRSAGFTMLEMMVVVSICLAIMVLIVPIFQVTTRTVQTVERKLALYEAARNILDILEFEIKMAVTNERGEQFCIKSLAWKDNDPFTPDTDATNTVHYTQSRRDADSIHYLKAQSGGFWNNFETPFPMSVSFPLAYYYHSYERPELWQGSVRTILTYPIETNSPPLTAMRDDFQYDRENSPTRNECCTDVSKIQSSIIYQNYTMTLHRQRPPGPQLQFDFSELWDKYPRRLAPGGEVWKPRAPERDFYFTEQKRITGINIMDLNISFWNAAPGKRRFEDPPDNTGIWFAPPPKMVRVTITVCDAEKRGRITLCRVIHIPVGTGECDPPAAQDNSYWLTTGPFSYPIAGASNAYNRYKYLPLLPRLSSRLTDNLSNPSTPSATFSRADATSLSSPAPKAINWP